MARALENWVFEENTTEWRKQALKLQAEHRKYESERKWRKEPIHRGYRLIEIK